MHSYKPTARSGLRNTIQVLMMSDEDFWFTNILGASPFAPPNSTYQQTPNRESGARIGIIGT